MSVATRPGNVWTATSLESRNGMSSDMWSKSTWVSQSLVLIALQLTRAEINSNVTLNTNIHKVFLNKKSCIMF